MQLLLASLAAAFAGTPRQEVPDFALEVRPLLSSRCFACHGPDEEARAAGLRLDERAAAIEPRDGGAAVVPGDSLASELVRRIRAVGEERMPPLETGHGLEEGEIQLLERWIAAGAPYARHWAFVPPVRPGRPEVEATDWPRTGLDAFVLARLEASGLQPTEEADRRTLLRRLSLDLIGLPPTPEEYADFLADDQPGAYERQVERLLASPRYGERWAQVWLDLARYADSSGYGSDPLREIWRYRDWVIEALNENLPFDEFTRMQLAGDLLPEPTTDDLLATAFHRNTMTNTEGGTDDEEFRVAAVKDRVNTTMQAWMGLTAGCAQCHNHKFDPLAQREYYELFDFFNHTADADRSNDQPRIPTPTSAQAAELERLDALLAAVEAELMQPTPELATARSDWEAGLRSAWTELSVRSARASTQGASFQHLSDGSVVASLGPEPVTTTLELSGVPADLRGLRLEVLADSSLPRGGPGLSGGNGNFVLSELRLTAPGSGSGPPRARYLRIDLPGEQRILSLAEVEVFSGGEQVALGAAVSQSSTGFGGLVERAVDGNSDGRYEQGSVTHTGTERDPWFELDLGRELPVERVVVHNRVDGDLEQRLAGALLTLRGEDRSVSWGSVLSHPGESISFTPAEGGEQIGLGSPQASHEQQGFPAARAIDGDAGSSSGWAIAPRQGEDHHLGLQLEVPEGALRRSGGRLLLELVQSYGSGHAIGRVRVLGTRDSGAISLEGGVLAALGRANRSAEDRQLIDRAFRETTPLLAELRGRRDSLMAERDGVRIPTTPVMQELPEDRRRTTRILLKGNFLTPGEEVMAAVPAAFHPWPEELPRNRLGLAEWLVCEENPLTARVAVNRIWARLFGTGIVETEEDFGSQGALPTHPELLDWLATEFMAGGWDQKQLLRTLVTSATYRQGSQVDGRRLEVDPDNRLLSRGPRVRLTAETVRDQALALAGLLSDELGGPSVYPPQPDGLWQAAFNGQRNWPTSTGADRWRRGIYVFLRRTIPYPSLATFDAPSRELCTTRRIRTNTPLQALVTLNDPAYVEAAQALGRRLVRALPGPPGELLEERAALGVELCTGHPARPEQVQALVELWQAARRVDDAEALALATDPLGPLPSELAGSEPELAAWSVVAGVLLNMDAVLVKD